jgi:hypothetical protein
MLDKIFGFYLIIAITVFGLWSWLFWKDTTTPKTHLVSWVVIFIAPWFWPLVLPLSLAELSGKLSNFKKTERPKPNFKSVRASE